MKITEKEFNVETGEEIFTEREETAPEVAEREAFEARIALLAQAEAEAKAAKESAQIKLAALGLTADDLKALGL